MKKQLIGALVGAVILFMWQFLSWSVGTIHGAEFQYTANQDKVMEALSANLTENGTYFMPQAFPEASSTEKQQYMQDHADKPWAIISYRTSFNTNMGMHMVRAFAVDFIAAFLFVWLLLQFAKLDFIKTVLSGLAVGIISYLTIPYLNSIWFETSSIGYLIDAIAAWGLTGVWLGWWLNRG